MLLLILRSIDSKKGWPPNTRFVQADLSKLPFEGNEFDRVISTCVFHHVDSPTVGLKEIRRVTKPGGTITIFMPNDPGLMYRTLRSATTLRRARSLGLLKVVSLVHALEHKNHYLSLKTICEWVFQNDHVEMKYFPFKFRNYNLNAFTVIKITKNFEN
jgi:ubiquinone/menaquinone biosynthesis C-methylase UbiE